MCSHLRDALCPTVISRTSSRADEERQSSFPHALEMPQQTREAAEKNFEQAVSPSRETSRCRSARPTRASASTIPNTAPSPI